MNELSIIVVSMIGLIGVAFGLAQFFFDLRLKKPFSCELCMCFWLCLVVSSFAFFKIETLKYFFYFAPLGLISIIKMIKL